MAVSLTNCLVIGGIILLLGGATFAVVIRMRFASLQSANKRLGAKVKQLREEIGRLQDENQFLLALNQRLEQQSVTDPLTGLLNRRGFEERLQLLLDLLPDEEPGLRQRQIVGLGIIMFDGDFFKQVNDQHGHLVGDMVLKDLAKLLQKTFRSQRSDAIGRFGGEEFMVAVPNVSLEDLSKVVEHLRTEVANHSFPEGVTLTVSGGAVHTCCIEPADALIDAADTLLYHSKEQGRNQVTVEQYQAR